jgi:hypothetical protein
MRARPTIPHATPMPAFAPVERPELLFCSDVTAPEVLAGEVDEAAVAAEPVVEEPVVEEPVVEEPVVEEPVVWELGVVVVDDEELEVVLVVSLVEMVTPWEPMVTTSTL